MHKNKHHVNPIEIYSIPLTPATWMCCIQQLMVLESELVRLSKENDALKNELNQVKETNHNMRQQLLGAQTQPTTLSNALKKVYIITHEIYF